MFGLGKKEVDEREILEEELPTKKKFRDLKPENRRQRIEPPKPWGKTERFLVFGVLGISVLTSALFAVVARGSLPVPKINLPDKRDFSFEQTFVFEKKPSSGDCCEKPILEFKNLTDDLSGTYGFYLIRLDGSVEYGLNGAETFKAASLIKIPTVVALYQMAEAGEIDLDSNYVLQEADKWPGNGSLYFQPAGTSFTFRRLAEYALHDSDNTAFNIFENYLGDRKIQEATLAMGLTQTSVYDNTTSPRDMAVLFKKLKNGELLNRKNSDEILAYMEETGFRDWLEKGVPGNITVQHKYGREVGVVDDVGIIHADSPYILAVLSKDVDESEADRVLPEISKAVFDFESGTD